MDPVPLPVTEASPVCTPELLPREEPDADPDPPAEIVPEWVPEAPASESFLEELELQPVQSHTDAAANIDERADKRIDVVLVTEATGHLGGEPHGSEMPKRGG
jgi:hypothetical protein